MNGTVVVPSYFFEPPIPHPISQGDTTFIKNLS